jgi:hypothetical protein
MNGLGPGPILPASSPQIIQSIRSKNFCPGVGSPAERGRINERHDLRLYVTRLDADPAIWERIGFYLKTIFARAELGEDVGRVDAGHA